MVGCAKTRISLFLTSTICHKIVSCYEEEIFVFKTLGKNLHSSGLSHFLSMLLHVIQQCEQQAFTLFIIRPSEGTV